MGGIGKVDDGEAGMEEGKRETVDVNGGNEGFTENVVDAGADEDDDANDFVETVNVDVELVEWDTLVDVGGVGGRERIGRGDGKVSNFFSSFLTLSLSFPLGSFGNSTLSPSSISLYWVNPAT